MAPAVRVQKRGMALWCLQGLDYRGDVPNLGDLVKDLAAVEIYQDGILQATSVGALAENLVG